MKRFLAVTAILLGLALSGCGSEPAEKAKPAAPEAQAEPTVLTVMTHDSFSVSAEVIAEFEKANNAAVKFLRTSGSGAGLNQAILAKGNPLADVFVGVDSTFFSRAVESGIFDPYASPALADIPDSLRLDPENRLTPVSFGDVCLNYDKKWFADKGLTPPATLEDLTKPEYRDLTVVENPATSSPGLAFLLATVSAFGEDGYLDYWKALAANGVKIADSWKSAYWGDFTAASDGTRPIVVSYASSPAAEVFYAEKKPAEAPTAAVLGPLTGFRQIEFAGVLSGTGKPELARKFIDFLLSRSFQEDIPLQMWVYPANVHAELPEVFQLHAKALDVPASLDPKAIAEGRERWIEAWTTTVLR
ncbi:thiamine transport system substrate-binding protein [Desulfobaculum xiamenense]|uniref:Thiamine transport system substrate-binding protein n=1 Tax=Desulfobaculum xiamenense TaxID=995050 RepID=A0A846QCP2_9BACT|nr:thiamine ABC transporter substrate-binding protein [Desulfobaculum xiamenense]NJB66486.1 thiamine transport system substrate-binding protein [Desulfobaculum xiamenense]